VYKGSGNTFATNSGSFPGMTSYAGTDFVETWHLKAESVPNASDGVMEMWINGTKYMNYSGISLNPNGWNQLEFPSVFRSPKYDQSLYVIDAKAWEIGKVPLAPIGTGSISVGETNVSVPLIFDTTDVGGVPTIIHPYVWDGTSFTKNALGLSDITISSGTEEHILFLTQD
jgi:hypothetical protein